MKIENLRRKIIINFSASAILLALVGVIMFYITKKNDSSNIEIAKIRSEANIIRSQTHELESQTNDAKKYKEVWKSISENKKDMRGIKMEEVNKSFDDIAAKYNIYDKSIQVVLPENLNGPIFDRKTLSTSYSSGTLTFDALTDVKALIFINEFFNTLPGYIIITGVDMTRSRKYTDDDLVSISLGKNPGALKVKVTFSWYVYHDKLGGKN